MESPNAAHKKPKTSVNAASPTLQGSKSRHFFAKHTLSVKLFHVKSTKVDIADGNMTLWLLIPSGLIVLIGLWAIFTYNGFVKRTTMVEEGWSSIDTQLKLRSNLIPNLLETVKGYMGHERGTLEAVIEARGKTMGAQGAAEQGMAEGLLGAALGKLFALAEAYPDLKASQNFAELQDTLEKVENEIQLARRYYNATVRDLNVLADSFPSNIIANIFTFRKAEFFEIDDPADRAVPEVKFD